MYLFINLFIENEKYGRRRSIRDSVSDDEDTTENPNADQSQRRVIRDDDNLSDVDDEEVEAMILTPEEVKLKTKVWYNANKTYLEEMAIKRMVEKDKGINPLSRKGKNKRKHVQPASTPAEAAKQLVAAKKISKKINHAVFDDMFESPESIAKIKVADELRKAQSDGSGAPPIFEVVEESGNVPTAAPNKSKEKGQETQGAGNEEEEDDDDEEMDLDDMADDERLMREGRARYYGSDNDEPYDYDDDDY
jgi:transcription factor IIIB subunit 2